MQLKAFRVTYLTKYNVHQTHIVMAEDWGSCLMVSVKAFSNGLDPLRSIKTIELLDDEPIIDR